MQLLKQDWCYVKENTVYVCFLGKHSLPYSVEIVERLSCKQLLLNNDTL